MNTLSCHPACKHSQKPVPYHQDAGCEKKNSPITWFSFNNNLFSGILEFKPVNKTCNYGWKSRKTMKNAQNMIADSGISGPVRKSLEVTSVDTTYMAWLTKVQLHLDRYEISALRKPWSSEALAGHCSIYQQWGPGVFTGGQTRHAHSLQCA